MLVDYIVFSILILAFCSIQVFACFMEASANSSFYDSDSDVEEMSVVNARPMTPRSAATNPVKIILNNDNIVN